MAEVLKIVSVFFASAVALGKLGIPTAIAVFKFDLVKILAVVLPGAIAGNIAFTYLSEAIIRGIHNYRVKRNLIHRKRIFTGFNRRVIRIKQRFGLAGLAFISPLILSTPLGAFLAERFYRHKRRIIIYLSISCVFWTLFLYFMCLFFYDQLKGWLI